MFAVKKFQLSGLNSDDKRYKTAHISCRVLFEQS